MEKRNKAILRAGLLLWWVVAMGLVMANGQMETTSRISGTVTDQTGAMVPDAAVTVRNEAMGATRSGVTDATGSFSFPLLLPGTYTVTVTKMGFRKAVVTGQVAQVAQPAQVNVILQLGTTSQTVTVSGAGAELVSTVNTEISGTVNATLVREIPVVRQNFFDLLALTPGVTPQNLAGNTTQLSFAGYAYNFVQGANGYTSSGVFVAGNRDSGSNVSVDGANVQSSVYQQTAQLQSPAGIEEMKVESGSMNAEFGSGVAAVNVITKSGTNQLHGQLYEMLRNNHFDATPFFTNLTKLNGVSQKLPNYEQNLFGGAAGGPIIKNKLLVFGNYEGFRVRQLTTSRETTPPQAMIQGNFANSAIQPRSIPMGTIYNPFIVADPTTGLRTPFPGNVIPTGATSLCAPQASCVDPVALAFLQKWVIPPNSVLNGNQYLTANASTQINSDQYNFRADFLKSNSNTLYGRFTTLNSPQTAYGIQPLEGTFDPYGSKSFVLHWTDVFKPTLVNDFMVGYSRPVWHYSRITKYGNVGQQIGLAGVSNLPGAPMFQVSGYNMDVQNGYLFDATEDNYQLKDDLSYVKGKHNFKFGIEVRNRRFYFISTSYDQGLYTIGSVYGAACPAGDKLCPFPATAGTTTAPAGQGGDGMVDFLLGADTGGSLIFKAPYTGYQAYWGGFAQDTWRATSKLTINYGLRYEYWTPWLLPRNLTYYWNSSGAGSITYVLKNPLDWVNASACYGSCGALNPGIGVGRAGYNVGNLNFAPRLGLSYALNSKTVLKASGGIFFDGNVNNNQMQDMQANVPPFGLRVDWISDPTQNLPLSGSYIRVGFSNLPTTGLPVPNTAQGFRVHQMYFPTATVDQWAFTVQRSLSNYWSMEVDYQGSVTAHEFMREDFNSAALPLGSLAGLSVQQRRRWPAWGILPGWEPMGWAHYEAGTVSLRNRPWHGLTFTSNFTWAKDLATDSIASSDSSSGNFWCRYCYAGDAQWVPRKHFIAGYYYSLPFGRNQQLASSLNPVLNKFVSGWAVSGITTLSTGSPQAVTDSTDFTQAAVYGIVFPNRLQGCNPANVPGGKNRLEWFNTGCFANPPVATWPNSPFGAIVWPGINNWDLGLLKNTTTGFPKESGRVEFRFEMYNAFNHTQFTGPNASYSLTSTSFGQLTTTRPARIIEFSLKYFF